MLGNWLGSRSRSRKLHKNSTIYDTFANEHSVHVGDQVYVYTPAMKVGTVYKFVCPFVAPYRVLYPYDTGIDKRLTFTPFSWKKRFCPRQVKKLLQK